MAAYAALVSLMNDLDLIPNHSTHSFSFDDKQMTPLSQTVHFLVDFMDTYDTHGCGREAAQVLESRIASAARAAHDVIESHVVDQIAAGSTFRRKARCYFLLDLQEAIDNMDFIRRKAVQFKEKSGSKAEQQPTYSSEPLKNVMVGFDAVAVRLMAMLTGEPSSQRVVPITGMGGMGKTTLARNVYDHLLIQQHFDVRLWATISQEYSVENILTQLLYGERKSTTGEDVNGLGEKLHKMLWGRRYLIVLDDMWSVEAWDEIQIFLPENGNGSCVIVTTRLSNLTAHLSSSSPFEMNFLDDDKSWQLFCGKAFGEEDCPVELEEIGKMMVKRCTGLPLSIVVIGGHLRRSSRAIEYWEKVANFMNPISSLVEDEQCLNIISLSYYHLPAYLKPCFLYMGIFKEDSRINASELLEHWVVEGFIKAKKGLSMEDVAEDYLKDLVERNLILVIGERSWNGKIRLCGIHDTVRELCLKVMKKDKFTRVLQDTTQGICRERRISILGGKKHNIDMIGGMESSLLLCSHLLRRGQFYRDDDLLVELTLLRVRVSANVKSNVLLNKDGHRPPYAVYDAHFRQLNLRFLDISHNHLPTRSFVMCCIPSSISLLWNMQLLIMRSCFRSVKMIAPYEIWEMPQLRQLVIRGYLPDPVPNEEEEECIVLRNLHTLVGVENLRLTEEVCKRMPNIKALDISYSNFYGNCEAISYYCLHNLGLFSKLESLKIHFDDDSKWRDLVLSFTFPTSLKELSLGNCHLDWEDSTMMIKSLHHLGSLRVASIKGSEWNLVDEEEFPCLKKLKILYCDDLIYWNADSSHFPVLEILYIWKATKLSEIPFNFGDIATLRRIELHDCSVSAAVSAMRIVVEQESLGNHDLQLHLHFFVRMEDVESFQRIVREEGLTCSNNVFLNSKKL